MNSNGNNVPENILQLYIYFNNISKYQHVMNDMTV